MSDEDKILAQRILDLMLENEKKIIDDHLIFDISDLSQLISKTVHYIKHDPIVIKIEIPCFVVGDLHGQYWDLIQFMKKIGDPKETRILFLGDYVDRGKNSIETITYLSCLKVLYPKNVFLLRGNHETRQISSSYGFNDECYDLYNTRKLWNDFNEMFDYLPFAAVIQDSFFCVHAGLSPELKYIHQLDSIHRPTEVQTSCILTDLLWSDPAIEVQGFEENARGLSYVYGVDVTESFLRENDIQTIIRSHQVVPEGYDYAFLPDSTVITVFSASCYAGECTNRGAIIHIDQNKSISMIVISSDPDDEWYPK